MNSTENLLLMIFGYIAYMIPYDIIVKYLGGILFIIGMICYTISLFRGVRR